MADSGRAAEGTMNVQAHALAVMIYGATGRERWKAAQMLKILQETGWAEQMTASFQFVGLWPKAVCCSNHHNNESNKVDSFSACWFLYCNNNYFITTNYN